MPPTPRDCAREILDVTPIIMQALRVEMRSHRLTDLTVPQFRTLIFINRNPGASLSAASEWIGLTLSSMSILVNGLVERGFVQRGTCSEDRRRIKLTLTPTGSAVLNSALVGAEALLAETLAVLSPAQRATVVEALELLRPLFLPRQTVQNRDALPEPQAILS